jgi:UDP:flavonoid glycosyltransferase YjiC (YdhE family)
VQVRVLVSFAGGHGHWLPTLPLARALADREHDVRYACQDAMVPNVIAAGWKAYPAGAATVLGLDERLPLMAPDREAIERSIAGGIDRHAGERARLLIEVCGRWRPELIVRDEADFGAGLAGDALGVPHVAVVVLAAGGLLRPELIAGPLARHRSELGLQAADPIARLHPSGLVAPVPASFRSPNSPLSDETKYVRPAVLEPPGLGPRSDQAAPAFEGDRPRNGKAYQVWATLGSTMGQESGDLLPRLIAGLDLARRRLGRLEALLAIGTSLRVGELGPIPEGTRVEPWAPIEQALAECDAVVSHGGSGTVVAALATGRPQVVLPMGADQPHNGDRCRKLDLAPVLDVLAATPSEVAEAVERVLTEPVWTERVASFAVECQALPPAASLVGWLEGLAACGNVGTH